MFFRVFVFLMVIAVVIVESDAALQCRGGRYRNDVSLVPESWMTCDDSVKFCILDTIVEQRPHQPRTTVKIVGWCDIANECDELGKTNGHCYNRDSSKPGIDMKNCCCNNNTYYLRCPKDNVRSYELTTTSAATTTMKMTTITSTKSATTKNATTKGATTKSAATESATTESATTEATNNPAHDSDAHSSSAAFAMYILVLVISVIITFS